MAVGSDTDRGADDGGVTSHQGQLRAALSCALARVTPEQLEEAVLNTSSTPISPHTAPLVSDKVARLAHILLGYKVSKPWAASGPSGKDNYTRVR